MKDYADALLKSSGLHHLAGYRHSVGSRPAHLAEPPYTLAPPVAEALRRAGIDRLYSHQAEALAKIEAGRPVLVVTPTASGKSLVYNLPVLQACASDPSVRALYVFPYKALEQDQRAAFQQMAAAFPAGSRPRCAIYDGDTPKEERRKLRADPPQVLITNPDMLHLGMLPYHDDWAGFLAGLKYVVIDELHVYRGTFGTHLHHIVHRLRRLCALYGSNPVFVAASATVGEPDRLGRELLGVDVDVIESSGAPASGRHFVFLDPGMEMSPYTAATRLMGQALKDGHRAITFTKARRITELIHSWILAAQPSLRGRIASYRAGYLPEERRKIESRLASGDLRGVVSTSALEHGIDIGGLDVCILVGYPGSIISSWQRIGRVGRLDRESLVVLVGMPDALDQYFLAHPDEFFSRPFERVVFDPANPVLAGGHLVCAGAELPLTPADREQYGDATFNLVHELAAEGRLLQDAEEERWYSLRRTPQRDLKLRSMGETFEIRNVYSKRSMGSIDSVRARHECHTGAIYLHAGRSYRIRSLDLEKRLILAEPDADGSVFTVALTEKETEILERRASADHGSFRAGLGRLKVTTWFRGYLVKSLHNQETISEHELDLPPAHFETVGLWVELPRALAAEVTRREGHFMGAIHATEHAAISLFPLLAVCDRWDLGGISYPHHPETGGPAFFIYDGQAGGLGLSAQGYERITELLSRTRELLRVCPCEEGCPSCVQSPKCGNGNRPLDKQSSLYLLDVLTGVEPVPEGGDMLDEVPTVTEGPGITPGTPADVPAPPAAAPPTPGAPPPAWPGAAPATRSVPALPAAGAAGLWTVPPAWPGVRAPSPETGTAAAGATPPAATRLPPPALPALGRPVAGDQPTPDLFFDLETLRSAETVGGWSRSSEMGMALAVVYDRGRDRWRTYRETEAEELIIDLMAARRVVGFNVKRFDYAVLSAYAQTDLRRIPTLDLLEEVHQILGFRLSLSHLSQATLGVAKSGDGLESLEWVRQGRWDLVEAYCRRDVELTARLFDFGRQQRHLRFRDRRGHTVKLPVKWT